MDLPRGDREDIDSRLWRVVAEYVLAIMLLLTVASAATELF